MERLAATCHRQGQLLSALRLYDRVIELGAATAETWCATGNALTDVGEYAQAIGAYERSLQQRREFPEAEHNLARVLYRLGEVDRAAAHLERAAAGCDALSPWLSLATLIPGSPMAGPARILDVRRAFATRLADVSRGGPELPPVPALPRAGERVRLGYLSAHFHRANYMKPVWGLINHHDRQAFDVHLFSDSPPDAGMPGYAGHRRDRVHVTAGLDNGAVAAVIRASGVHVLIDLGAYSVPERLALFTRRVAPVTAAWFNLYATSGLPGIDYVVGDRAVAPAGDERFFTETVLRLPMSYLTFDILHEVPPVVPPPCLGGQPLVFGSLVSQYKITPPVIAAWAEILRRAEGTRLLLANATLKSVHNRQYVLDRFAEHGVTGDRLVMEGPAENRAFLQKYDRIDVALDAFPYNGGTTTMEAIWQGVPVLTFAGDRWASRTSQSLLCQTHLAPFVTGSSREYVEMAVALASESATPARLAGLRGEMRERLRQSPVCDVSRFARSMEQLCQSMVSRAAAGTSGVSGSR